MFKVPFVYLKVELLEFLGAGAEGCKFGSIPRTTVTIANDDEYQDIINNMIAMTEAQLAELSLYQSDWGKQLKNAMLGEIVHCVLIVQLKPKASYQS